MRFIESEGDSIDEAISRALQTLQVERDQAEVEILSDATRGLFGFGGKKARVRATVRAPLLSRLDGVMVAENDSRETSSSAPAAASADDTTATPGDFEARCKTVLGELIRHLGISCEISVRPGDGPGSIVLDVKGDSGGLLIGRRGQTLDAIEYITNRIVARGDDHARNRVSVDVEHYRERRQEYLTALAHRLADKVKQTGRVVTLNPMSPRDRRIVHIALQNDAAVATRSQGDGHYRKVLIVSADRARRGGTRTTRLEG